MQCANGHDVPDGQRFCGECGAAVASEVGPETLAAVEGGPTAGVDSAGSKKSRVPAVVGIATAAVVIAVVGLTLA
ncbi:MAG TPA: hypothetical protein VEA78_02875, partial [Acidimicrobiales bacterium]|nr:hypothetical protein [Acidimicrobiales bacterium]